MRVNIILLAFSQQLCAMEIQILLAKWNYISQMEDKKMLVSFQEADTNLKTLIG